MTNRKEPRFTVRFNNGEHETERPLPIERARRIAERGIGEHGKFKDGVAELVHAGEVFETVTTIPEEPV